MEDSKAGRFVEDSLTEQIHVIMPRHLNGHGSLFGGQLAMWIDVLAGVVATRHCRMKITTAAMDNLQFRAPAGLGEVILMRGSMTHTGRTSMEVRVDSYAENVRTGEHKLINTAFITLVGLDENDQPHAVPPLLTRTPEEAEAFQNAEKRRELRKKKAELYE